jgi:ketosteroid isomerase-like protein
MRRLRRAGLTVPSARAFAAPARGARRRFAPVLAGQNARGAAWSRRSNADAGRRAGAILQAMSQENVELVRSAFAAWNRGDLDAWLDHWDEQAQIYPLRAQLEGRAYNGHEGLRRFLADMAEDWEGLRFEMDEIREADEQIVGSGRFQARGRVSGIELDVPLGVIGVVRKGKLVYARFFSDPADAIAAAGSPEKRPPS